MTPEELPMSEEPTNIKDPDVVVPSSSGTITLRVKNVSEINTNEAEDSASQISKRRLPSWMFISSQSPNGSNKKQKTSQTQELEIPDSSENSTSNGNVSSESAITGELEDAEISNSGIALGGGGHENECNNEDSNEAEPTNAIENNEASHDATTADTGEPDQATGSSDVKPIIKVEEAISTTMRNSCKYGIRCYRRNPIHFREEAHPGEHDYRRPTFPPAPDGAPKCPYGNFCYRLNPIHFQHYSHTVGLQRTRRRPPAVQKDEPSSEDDFEDPYATDVDNDEDYQPDNGDSSEEQHPSLFTPD